MNEILRINATPEMFQLPYCAAHAAEIHALTEKIIYFDNVMYQDKVNKPYFEGMNPYTKQVLDHVLGMYGHLCQLFITQMGTKAVAPNAEDGVVKAKTLKNNPKMMNMIRQTALQEKEREIGEIEKAADKQVEKLMKTAIQQTIEDRAAQKEEIEASAQIKVTSDFTTGLALDDIESVRTRMVKNPDLYEANHEVLDRAFQELYQAIDALGDLNLEVAAAQELSEEYRYRYRKSKRMDDQEIMNSLVHYQEKVQIPQADLGQQISALRTKKGWRRRCA